MSLAPLSKAQRLKHLDLSNDFYDIDLSQLLQAVCDLAYLTHLSTPKGAMKRAYASTKQRYRWPPSLHHLRLSGTMSNAVNEWESLLMDLPASLRILTLSFLSSPARSLQALPDVFWFVSSSAKQVTSLHILHTRYSSIGAVALFRPFPNLKLLNLPYDRLSLEEMGNFFGQDVLSPTLEDLVLTDDPYVCSEELNRVDSAMGFEDLSRVVSQLPSLKRLELPGRYYPDLRESDVADIDILQRRFSERWPSESQSEVGVFLREPKGEDEPSWVKNTWGARSVKKLRADYQ